MFKIIKKECLSPGVYRYDVEAPRIAKKTQPGQFIILRVDEVGERIPLTVADFDHDYFSGRRGVDRGTCGAR